MKRLVAAAVAVLAIAALPGIVLGHAELVSSDPPAGGTLTTTPYTLTATFDDELTPDGSSIVVEGPDGAQVATGTVSETDEFTMTAELPALADGEYMVRWTAVSADDAAVERGTYVFSVAATPSPTASAAPSATTSATTSATPSATAIPTPSATVAPGDGATSSTDVLLAIGIAAILIVVIIGFVVLRGRR